jgi:hypothetical protein
MRDLPRPQVRRCFFEESFQPPLSAMELEWNPDAPGVAERCWHLPSGVSVKGPAPARFGITIYRHGDDAYQVRVLWDGLCLRWERLTRVQIMASSLTAVLTALGTDLWHILIQPVSPASETAALAA